MLAHDADIHFIVAATSSGLTAVDLSSPTGMKEAKRFRCSSSRGHSRDINWSMMLLGLAGLGYAARCGARKQRVSITEA